MTGNEQFLSKPECGFGTLGICCQDCGLGPCRFNPFSKEPQLSKFGGHFIFDGGEGEEMVRTINKLFEKRMASVPATS